MTMVPEKHTVFPNRFQLSTPFASDGALTVDERFTLPAISSTPASPPSAAAYEHWKAAFADPLRAASSGVYINDLPVGWPASASTSYHHSRFALPRPQIPPAVPTISFPRFHREPALFATRELLTTPVLFAGTGPTLFAMHTEEAGIVAVNTLIEGAPKVWWILRPSDTLKFEELLRSRSFLLLNALSSGPLIAIFFRPRRARRNPRSPRPKAGLGQCALLTAARRLSRPSRPF